ncbi:MAG TPA: chorismate-binding protein, partial [Solirubrobacteraceae bacterium]|nr:chorismate-binding protein [Solirubrobacteraceae bacterium]
MLATDSSSPFTLTVGDRERLLARLQRALVRTRRSGEQTLATISVTLPKTVDPAQVACASRRPGEPWFLFEQPDRGGAALAGLGAVVTLSARGPGRFSDVAERWRALVGSAAADPLDGPPGSGPIAFGGFAFADDGGSAPHWDGFDPGAMTVPEIAFSRREGVVRMTLAVLTAADDIAEELLERLIERTRELREAELPLLDPAPVGRFQISSPLAPEHYEQAVARAKQMIVEGRFEKIVLSREVHVHAPAPYDAAAVFAVLRREFPSCFCFCVGSGEVALIAASPELLARRDGQRVSTLALAASTRRSADPAVDDH